MKKLDTNKLTEKQADLFKNNLVYIATVDENGNPQVGPKGSMTVLDPSHMQYLEKTKGAAYENIKRGSKVALVAADVPSHTAVLRNTESALFWRVSCQHKKVSVLPRLPIPEQLFCMACSLHLH